MADREHDVGDWPGFHGRAAYDDDVGGDDMPLSEDEAALMRNFGAAGTTRRDFMKMLAAAGISLPAVQMLLGCQSGTNQQAAAGGAGAPAAGGGGMETVA